MIFVLKHMEVLERMPWLAQEAVFKKLASVADVASLSKQERIAYDESLRIYRDTIAVMDYQYEEGKAKGMAEGMAKGVAEGMAKGMAEGEDNANRNSARKMKAKGYAVDDIIEITGLTADEIEKL